MAQRTPVPGKRGFVFASTSRRVVAWFIDDILLAFGGLLLAGVAAQALSIDYTGTASAVFGVISFAYYVFFWTSKRQATPGMRALKLQIGTAFDGRPLAYGPAILRWAVLGYPLSLIYLVPSTGNVVSLALYAWFIVLLVTTNASETKQGLHDRAARTAMVQPAGLRRGLLITGCLIIAVGSLLFGLATFILTILGDPITGLGSV